ncbi:MAG: hypothetical protein HY400_00515, partial [Elusimicrobia bacterium]|nr:hypothetical protein [Elusimicrobiota bacterium]
CINQNTKCSTTDGQGREGSIAVSTAGAVLTVRVMAVDQYFNPVGVSSQPVFNLVTTQDPRDNAESLYTGTTLSNGNNTYTITLISKGTDRTVAALGAGDSGGWTTTANINVKARTTSSPKKILAILPTEEVNSSYSTGKAPCPSNCPSNRVAGSTFSVTVYAADEYMNTYDPSDGITQPAVYLVTSDPYDVDPATLTLVGATTGFAVNMVQASTQAVSARTATAGYTNYEAISLPLTAGATIVTVVPDTAKKLQILMPGEVARPGKSPYDENPTTGGKDNSPDILIAGDTAYATINCVDRYFNRVTGCNPTVNVEFANTNTIEDDDNGDFANKALINGTNSFAIRYLATGWQGGGSLGSSRTVTAQEIGTSCSGVACVADSRSVGVKPNTSQKLQVVVRPGAVSCPTAGSVDQLERPGSATGLQAGCGVNAGGNKKAGQGFTARINAVDQFFNRKNYPGEVDNRNIRIVTSDIYDTENDGSSWTSIPLGSRGTPASLDITVTPKQSTNTLKVEAYDVGGVLSTGTASGIGVDPNNATQLHMVMDCGPGCGEKLEPGSGVLGTPQDAVAGARMALKVYLVDDNFNKVSASTGAVKIESSDTDDFDLMASTKDISSGVATWTTSNGPILFNARANASLKAELVDPGTLVPLAGAYTADTQSSTFTVNTSGFSRLIVRFDEQFHVPGQPDDLSDPLGANGFNCAFNYNRCGKDPDFLINSKTAGIPYQIEVIATDFYYNLVSTNPSVDVVVS